jgi:hypothetical protein
VDEDHPAIRNVLEEAGPLLPAIRTMLRVIEESVPVQRIWLDTAEDRETPRTGFAETSSEEILVVLMPLYRNMVRRKGMTCAEARERLSCMEPFHLHPGLVSGLPDIGTPEE